MRAAQWGWYLYDWANSAFTTSVTAVFAGPYLRASATTIPNSPALAFFPLLLLVSILLRSAACPFITGFAELGHRNRQVFFFFSYLGAFFTIMSGVLTPDQTAWLSLCL